MPRKPHLYFRNPSEGVIIFKQRKGGGSSKNKDDEEPDYKPMANVFSKCIKDFRKSKAYRVEHRTLSIQTHFDMIELEFQDYFDQPKYEETYLNQFGLALVHLSYFNRKGLFIIDDTIKFAYYFQNIQIFIENTEQIKDLDFNKNIRFLRSFKLYSSTDMIRSVNDYAVVHFSLINHLLRDDSLINPQKELLEVYLKERNIEYLFNEENLEVYDFSEILMNDVLNNFDIIYATCSGSGAIIRTNLFNQPLRNFGFNITNSDEDLPIIGVVDSGVSNQTPLASILIADEDADEYDLTETGVFFDNVDHATAVACFASLGKSLIPDYRGEVEADARILSMKILNEDNFAISQSRIVELIRKAYIEKGVRIFTLTVAYTMFPLKDNQEFSSYAIALDKLAYELDLLIFISTSNTNDVNDESSYPVFFKNEYANIASPAESMNNITVGAISDNYENLNDDIRRSGLKNFPAIYSRKFNYDFDNQDLAKYKSKHLSKPDILLPGGDYETCEYGGFVAGGKLSIECLSSDLRERTYRCIGTSFSAPLAANLAAKLLRLYPNMNMQSVKALILNSARLPDLGNSFSMLSKNSLHRIVGLGIPDEYRLLYSDENQLSLLLEDSIIIGDIKSFELRLPEYLNNAKRKNALLKISATLCFNFLPITNNQFLYCPIHLAVLICNNLPLDSDNGELKINGANSKDIKIASNDAWSQDYYFKARLVSNTQKIHVNIAKNKIIEENNCLKIAVNSAFHKLLADQDKTKYRDIPINFSIAINIEQCPLKNEVLEDLYDELEAVNNLESMLDLEAELDINL
ncbi:MAG: S8 family serine peptidase [Marinifilaceae bacterium]